MARSEKVRHADGSVTIQSADPNVSPAPGYVDRELERARAVEHPIGSCGECGCTIFENPGYCTLCDWDRP